MNNTRLIVYSIAIIASIVGLPHYVAKNLNVNILNTDLVDYFFYVFNDLSVVYIIIPFFVIELLRYLYLKRLNKDVILDSIANIITVFAFQAIEYVLGGLFFLKLYTFASEYSILPHLPMNWITVASAILLADFLYYWEHRLMHRIGVGWATHTVHHSSPHFNMSVAYRFGPLDGIFPLLFSIPAVFLGFNPFLMFAAELFVQTFQAILHTEIIKKLPRPIEYLFNTPSHHRAHHGSNKQYWDKNYAGILIIWDRIFGTFEVEKEKVVYGISEPLNSVNPIKVFFHGFTRFYKRLKETKGVNNKFLLFIKPPDWAPKKD